MTHRSIRIYAILVIVASLGTATELLMGVRLVDAFRQEAATLADPHARVRARP